jgi:hypothetical protein
MLLMIDNYDSFTFNIVQYLGELGADVKVVRNDEITVAEMAALNPDHIVFSPGPCTPNEAGVCVDEHLALPKLRRYWDDPQGAPTALLAPLVHIVREPLETCISAYQYHLVSTEAWLRTPRPEDLVRRGPTAGLPWQAVLRQADTRTGLRLECRRSIHDQIVQQADIFPGATLCVGGFGLCGSARAAPPAHTVMQPTFESACAHTHLSFSPCAPQSQRISSPRWCARAPVN